MFRSVEPGVSQGNEVEIVSNLDPGTRIVAQGAAMVSDGITLQFADKDRPVKAGPGGPSSENRKQPLRADISPAETRTAN